VKFIGFTCNSEEISSIFAIQIDLLTDYTISSFYFYIYYQHFSYLSKVERVTKKGKPVFVLFVDDANKPVTGEKSIMKITDQVNDCNLH